ncbi:MAG: hypothetical protein R3E82_11810 [Pseudomonadales bacterium]|nr:hypothetical protein [Pseudomonadales bacterium]
MKMLTLCLLLLSSYAAADADDAVVRSSALAVKDRIQTLELINVTAQRPVSDAAEPLDAELAALLAEVEALETEEAE